MKCINCGGEVVPTTTTYKFKTIPPIKVQYLEAYKCLQCYEVYLTRSAKYKIEAIEEKLRETSEVNWEPIAA